MVSAKFELAYIEVGLLENAPTPDERLKLYALAKVAHNEDIKSKPAPGMFAFEEKEKRKAWQKLVDEGKTAEQADKEYIETVEAYKKKYGFKSDDKLKADEKTKLAAAKEKAGVA